MASAAQEPPGAVALRKHAMHAPMGGWLGPQTKVWEHSAEHAAPTLQAQS